MPVPLAAGAFLGRHPAVLRLVEAAERLARGVHPVLLLGETGTGKELLARILHARSPRAEGPFVALNCASIPAGLLEAEVFGAARGAYTGAVEGRAGLLEGADGGTLFLDEVGDMPPPMQAALLRVLEDGRTRRLGEARERSVGFRLVAATNHDLDAMVAAGEFRADLRWRLGTALRVPPLRDRREDLPILAAAFLAEAADGLAPKRLAPGALRRLQEHRFPGNARELRGILLAAHELAPGEEIAEEHLPLEPEPGAHRRAGVLEVLGPGDEASVREVCARTGLPRRSAQRALAALASAGTVVRSGRGPATRYRLA